LNTSKPLFIQLEKIDLSKLITFVSISNIREFEKVLEEEHELGFDQYDTNPLWRIVVGIVENEALDDKLGFDFSITFFWHHAIGDGMSSFGIQGAFLKELNETLKNVDLSNILTFSVSSLCEISSPPPLCLPIEERLDIRPNVLQVLKAICQFLVPSFMRKYIYGKYCAGDVHFKDAQDFRTS
ncbi:3516_t:CDS:1, partial [Diversispora eburnea]